MFKFMHVIPKRGGHTLTVTLDMNPSDVIASDETTGQMVAEAKKAKRKFCAIHREYASTTLFTYDPANLAQIELQLLTMLSAPRTEVTVNAETGGIESWSSH
jgi:hypothetical protein